MIRLADAVNNVIGHPLAVGLTAITLIIYGMLGEHYGFDPFPFGTLANCIQVSSLFFLVTMTASQMIQNRVADARSAALAETLNQQIEMIHEIYATLCQVLPPASLPKVELADIFSEEA